VEKKSPLQSKKFIAFMTDSFLWKVLMVLVLITVPPGAHQTAILCSLIAVNAFVSVGYILGQASLDKFLHLAQMGHNLALEAVGIKSPSGDIQIEEFIDIDVSDEEEDP